MITIIALNPAFGASYNLRKAFSLWEETRLITLDVHKLWPGEEDILLTQENVKECRQLIETSRFTMIAGASGIYKGILQLLGGKYWLRWAKKQRWIPYWGDTAYFRDAQFYNDLMDTLKVKTIFTMMDLMSKAPKRAIPLCHPVEDLQPTVKPPWIQVMHSPRSERKYWLKGSDTIERVMGQICEEFSRVDYQTIMNVHYRTCLQLKRDAHIFIDQIPGEGMPAGLGRSGEEALANGSIVLTALHGTEYLNGHFCPPPVIKVYDEAGLYQEMRRLCQLDREELAALGQQSRAWAEKYLLFPGWLEYVRQYV